MMTKSSFGPALMLGSLMLLGTALGCGKGGDESTPAEATGKMDKAEKKAEKKAEPAAPKAELAAPKATLATPKAGLAAPKATMVVYTIADA